MPSKQIVENGATGLKDASPQTVSAFVNDMSARMGVEMPRVGTDVTSLRQYGETLFGNKSYRNAWNNALFNLIAEVYVNNMYWNDPWISITQKGRLEYGETVEDVWIDLAYVEEFSSDKPQGLTEYQKAKILSAFHTMNYQKRYIMSVNEAQLRKAFFSFQGMFDFVSKCRDTMFNSARFDNFLAGKYELARAILNGCMKVETVPQLGTAKEDVEDVVAHIRKVSNDMTFPSNEMNEAHVYNTTERSKQIIIMDTDFDAKMSVKVLATAFNMDEAQFMGQRLLTRGFHFNKAEKERLAVLFAKDPGYKELTSDEENALKTVYAVHMDKDWFFVLNNLFEFRTFENGYTLAENNFLHDWKIISHSPYRNAVVYTTGTPSVTKVDVVPTTITLPKGTTVKLDAVVSAVSFASKSLGWEVSGNTAPGTTITLDGELHVSANETAQTLTVTATSIFDPTKKGTCTVTVSS